MFWNDPNLYSVAFKDIPNVPFGPYATTPRIPFGMTQPYLPQQFTPYAPWLHTQGFNPFFNQITPQIPQFPPYTPYLHTQTFNPYLNPVTPQVPQLPQFSSFTPYMQPPMMPPFYGSLPLYNFYRPFVF